VQVSEKPLGQARNESLFKKGLSEKPRKVWVWGSYPQTLSGV